MINFTKEKILITGANGFVGKNLVDYFALKKVKVFCLNADLKKFITLNNYIKKIKPSIVFHLGAYVNLSRDFKTARECFLVNTLGTFNLLESLSTLKLLPKKVILLSSEEVYGNGKIPYREDQKVLPPSPYSISKAASENLGLFCFKNYGLPVVILRLATVFGPGQPENRFIPNLIKKALTDTPILTHGADQQRDYLFIDDVIRGIILAATNKKTDGEIINLGNSNSTSLEKLINLILKETKSKSKVIYGTVLKRKGEAKKWASDISKAKKILGWQPKISLENGLIKTINYLKKNDQIN